MTLKNLFGSAPDQVPLNRDLGNLAFQNDDAVNITGTLTTTKTNKAVIDELTHDTSVASIPTVLMNFTRGTPTLDNRVVFSRATTATYMGADGYVKTAAINEPRFEYDVTTKQCLGLLMEEGRTNQLKYSEDFSQWAILSNFASTSASVLAPNGLIGCKKVTNPTGLGVAPSVRSDIVTITSGARVMATVYAKAAERKNIRVMILDNATATIGVGCYYDLAAGAEFGSAFVGTGSTLTHNSITALPNGWYKIVLGGVCGTETNIKLWISIYDDAYSRIWGTGAVDTGFYLWAAQLEIGNYPTSYIPTTSSTVTRNIDIAYLSTDTSWFNAAEGTMFCEARTNNSVQGDILRMISLNEGATANRIETYISTAGSSAHPTQISGSTVANGNSTFTSINTQPVKSAYAYKANDFSWVSDGSTSTSGASSGAIPVVNRLSIGHSYALSSSSLNGYVRKIAYYPFRLSNNELVEITRI